MTILRSLITLFTHSIFHSEKQTKNPPHLPISGKFYFQPSLKSGSLFTLLEKEKKKKKQGPGSPAEKVACGEGPLEKSRGPDHTGCRAAKGFRVRETETEGVCWETEATAQPRSQGEAGGGHRDRGEGQNLASEQKASFEAHESRDLVPWSCPL